MPFFLFSLLALLINPVPQQENSKLAGQWVGYITQDEGGYRTKYDFELYLYQQGRNIEGRSYVYVDNIFAEMTLTGRLKASVYVEFKESEIVDSRQFDGMEWCLKNAQLVLRRKGQEWIMEGYWQGLTSFSDCIPGKVYLTKVIPRA
jgi:hypothetical protein